MKLDDFYILKTDVVANLRTAEWNPRDQSAIYKSFQGEDIYDTPLKILDIVSSFSIAWAKVSNSSDEIFWIRTEALEEYEK